MENKKIEFMKNFISDREKLIKILLWGSVALDIFLVLCFVIGFALGMGSSEIGFFMIGIIFRYGLILFIISIILKFVAFILSFRRDTKEKTILNLNYINLRVEVERNLNILINFFVYVNNL